MRQGGANTWIVAAVTFLILLATAGVRATPAILMVPLEREFGWDPSLLGSLSWGQLFLASCFGLLLWLLIRQTAWAPDAVVELSRALVALKKAPDACQTLAELGRKYPKAPAAVKARAANVREQAKCG